MDVSRDVKDAVRMSPQIHKLAHIMLFSRRSWASASSLLNHHIPFC